MTDSWDLENIQRSMLELGGKKLAKNQIVSWLEQVDRSTPSLVATMVGLPLNITMQLLNELEQEDCAYYQELGSLRLWRASNKEVER